MSLYPNYICPRCGKTLNRPLEMCSYCGYKTDVIDIPQRKLKCVSEKVIIRLIGPYYNGCCSSCHEDEELGYSMCELDLGKNRYAEVCCAVKMAFEEWLEAKKAVETALQAIEERKVYPLKDDDLKKWIEEVEEDEI